MSSLTVEKLHAFHASEREIFFKLVLMFSRPLAESLLVMATWFWLEDFGFENIFSSILILEDPFIAFLANEAVSSYMCLCKPDPPLIGSDKIPFTARLLKRDISLQTIYQNKYTAIIGIKNFLNTICSRVFTDILLRVLPPFSSPTYSFSFTRRPLFIPGFPDPIFGNIHVMHDVVDWNSLPNYNSFSFVNGLWKWNATCIATHNERTMFVTFSRGYPVTRYEVKKLFNDIYGEDSVEDVYIPKVYVKLPNGIVYSKGEEQALWGRVTLDSVVTVDRVLSGMSVKRFVSKGKHIWARKYNDVHIPNK